MPVRKAVREDLPAVAGIYEQIHDREEAGLSTTGWLRGIYPTAETAAAALERQDLFVLEEDGEILGAAVINQHQMDGYADGAWAHEARDGEVCVLHTLVISPRAHGRGLGKRFVAFYEDYARENGFHELRMDTNARNLAARALYRGLGYSEVGSIPTVFNGIPGVELILLEKTLTANGKDG